MDAAEAGQFVVVMLSPTLIIGSGLMVPRVVRVVRRRVRQRRAAHTLQPAHPPIEQLAADLRRLLLRHDAVRQSTGMAMRARHLGALEAAIGDCACQAAAALGLAGGDRPGRAPMTTPELRRLLHALADSGLVLVPATGLLVRDERG